MKNQEQITNSLHLQVAKIANDGGCGIIRYGKLYASVIWSFGGGWEHVSVAPFKPSYVPSWEDMCRVKDMFWNEDEAVVQIHPAKSQYVNNLPNCLHLWRPNDEVMPLPPSIMVGMRDGQSLASARQEIAALPE